MGLTRSEADILEMLTKEYLTPMQIARRRKVSYQTIYKTMARLQNKGYLTPLNEVAPEKVEYSSPFKNFSIEKHKKGEPSLPVETHSIRLHGQRFRISILINGCKSLNLYKSGQPKTTILDGNVIKIHRRSVEIFSNKDFFGKTPGDATESSMQYWIPFFRKVERRTGLMLLKDGYQNISITAQHYAETDNELAKDMHSRGKTLRFRGQDGKVWLLADDSLGLKELETVHPQTSQGDMENLQYFMEDVRLHPVHMSDVVASIKRLSEIQETTIQSLNAIIELIRPREPERKGEVERDVRYIG